MVDWYAYASEVTRKQFRVFVLCICGSVDVFRYIYPSPSSHHLFLRSFENDKPETGALQCMCSLYDLLISASVTDLGKIIVISDRDLYEHV